MPNNETMWSLEQPVLVVAPHLIHPARNGADISLERVARFLSLHTVLVDLVGCDTVRRYEGGDLVRETPFANRMRSKRVGGVRALLKRSHYLLERFNTPQISRIVEQMFVTERYGTVLASYLTTLPLLPIRMPGQRYLVWTHNDDFKWFEDLLQQVKNPMGRQVARVSLNWLQRAVPRLAQEAVFLHVTEKDWQGFERVAPGHRHLIVSIGTDIDVNPVWPTVEESSPIILTFTGGLAVQMATDALRHFHDTFEATLKAAFGARLRIRVVGSRPSEAVRSMVAQNVWELYADVSDEALSSLLRESTFTILPFAYATGVKLKLIRSLGSGIPFLSTSQSRFDRLELPTICCCSDDPQQWLATANAWIALPDKLGAHRALLEVARGYSWPACVRALAEELKRFE